jgi:hypothetical protein
VRSPLTSSSASRMSVALCKGNFLTRKIRIAELKPGDFHDLLAIGVT